MIEVDIDKKLKDFHLRVSFRAGNELVALFGPSGAGKSLTLQCIAGLARPDTGRIVINDKVAFDSDKRISRSPQDRRVGYVFQNYALFPHLNVEENIAYGLHGLRRGERPARVRDMIGLMRLEGLGSHRPSELSGGQQQRVALARALAIEPSILLLDEPFSALDSAIRSKLRAELLQLLRPLGVTIVLVTHNLEEAYSLSETMVVYDTGRVLQVGTRDEVLCRPRTRAVARFTGAKNIFSGTVAVSSDTGLEIEGDSFRVLAPAYPFEVGRKVDFCVRPEHIMLVRADRASQGPVKENQLGGRIVHEVARGASHLLLFKVDGWDNGRQYDLHIEVPVHVYQRLDLGEQKRWTVSLKKSAIHVMAAESFS
ncbi:MAG: ABC transporter ATP-binding protein [Chloroflexi bacterium]|nr:ABC transporter ATP-binding protein [Chloroflexota bacterium]